MLICFVVAGVDGMGSCDWARDAELWKAEGHRAGCMSRPCSCSVVLTEMPPLPASFNILGMYRSLAAEEDGWSKFIGDFFLFVLLVRWALMVLRDGDFEGRHRPRPAGLGGFALHLWVIFLDLPSWLHRRVLAAEGARGHSTCSLSVRMRCVNIASMGRSYCPRLE